MSWLLSTPHLGCHGLNVSFHIVLAQEALSVGCRLSAVPTSHARVVSSSSRGSTTLAHCLARVSSNCCCVPADTERKNAADPALINDHHCVLHVNTATLPHQHKPNPLLATQCTFSAHIIQKTRYPCLDRVNRKASHTPTTNQCGGLMQTATQIDQPRST